MASWANEQLPAEDAERWTSPDFPGYEIFHYTDIGGAAYLVSSPTGPIGARPHFEAAVELVEEDARPVAAKFPAAVAVDTQDGYVFRNAEDGVMFTVETAQAFADRRNEHLKVPTYRVFELVPVGETKCTACGQPVGSICWRCA